MWSIVKGPESIASSGDNRRVRFVLRENEDERETVVEFAGIARACGPATLSGPVARAIRSDGRDAVERYSAEGEPPSLIEVSTVGTWPSIAPVFSGS